MSVHEHDIPHPEEQTLYQVPLYHHGRGPPPDPLMPDPTPGHHSLNPVHPVAQSSRHGRMVTAQTWQSHPEFYREVMSCLAE
jgi:hypothetical protein